MVWRVVFLALAGCGTVGAEGRNPGGAGGATTSALADAGGHGGGAECAAAADCPGADAECRARACVGGVCAWANAAAGLAVAEQVEGDCRRRVCDGAGGVVVIADDTDVLDDHNDCTHDACASGDVLNVPRVAGACGPGGAGVCDGRGDCVDCVVPADCASGGPCIDNRCVPPACLDHAKDGDETDVDCGGAKCLPCADGLACAIGRDCRSGVCDPASHVCAAARCGDGVRNGDETDVDCGGSCAMRCGAGRRCGLDDDCLGGLCSGAVCLPSCVDGVQNGGESGVDCGGDTCPPCAAKSSALPPRERRRHARDHLALRPLRHRL